jgi:hypothetical protein
MHPSKETANRPRRSRVWIEARPTEKPIIKAIDIHPNAVQSAQK